MTLASRKRIGSPTPGTAAHRIQRAVLFELLVDVQPGGEHISELAGRVREDPDAVRAAVAALAEVGLVEAGPDRICAAPAALYFDALWPIVI